MFRKTGELRRLNYVVLLTLVVEVLLPARTTRTQAQSPSAGLSVKLEVRDRSEWVQISLTSPELLAPLSVHCGCQSMPVIFAAKTTVRERNSLTNAPLPKESVEVYGDVYESSQEAARDCPSKLPLQGAIGTLLLKGRVDVEIKEGSPIVRGTLYDAGKTAENATVRITIENLAASATNYCPNSPSDPSSTTVANSSGSNTSGSNSTQRTPMTINLQTSREQFTARATQEPSGYELPLYDSFNRSVPHVENAVGVDQNQRITPLCPPGQSATNPFPQGPACDGFLTIHMRAGPLILTYTPAGGTVGGSFLGIPGLSHQYSYRLTTTNDPRARDMFTHLISPGGERVALYRVNGPEHKPLNPLWDPRGLTTAIFGGLASLTAQVKIGDTTLNFGRNNKTETSFNLRSLVTRNSSIAFQAVGPDTDRPTQFWIREGEALVLYSVTWGAGSITIRETRRQDGSGTTQNLDKEVARILVKEGFIAGVLSDQLATSVVSTRTARGVPVITALLTGPTSGAIETARTFRYDRDGRITFLSTGVTEPATQSFTYTPDGIKLRDSGANEETEYRYQRSGTEVLLSSIQSRESTLSYIYDSTRGNVLKEVRDSRYNTPVLSIEEVQVASRVRWSDLLESNDWTFSLTPQRDTHTIITTQRNSSVPASRVVVERTGNTETSTFSQGKVKVTTSTSNQSKGASTIKTLVEVDGKKVDDSTAEFITQKLQGNMTRQVQITRDGITGASTSVIASHSPSSRSLERTTTSASGLSWSRKMTMSSTGSGLAVVESHSFLNRPTGLTSLQIDGDETIASERTAVLGAYRWHEQHLNRTRHQDGRVEDKESSSWEASDTP